MRRLRFAITAALVALGVAACSCAPAPPPPGADDGPDTIEVCEVREPGRLWAIFVTDTDHRDGRPLCTDIVCPPIPDGHEAIDTPVLDPEPGSIGWIECLTTRPR